MARPAIAQLLPPELARTLGASRSGVYKALPTGIETLDLALQGGVPRGAVTEIFGEFGQGAWWLGLHLLAQVKDKICALIEPAGTFFPPGAAALGVDLGRLLVIRESNRKQALWALERISHEKVVGATLAVMERMSELEVRRLQLAAEASGQVLLLLRNPREISRASWGALRLHVHARPGQRNGRCLVVETLRARGALAPRPVLLEIEHATDAVRLSALLPHATGGTVTARFAG